MYKPTFGLLVQFALFSLIVAIPEPVLDSVKIDELEKRTEWNSGSGLLYFQSQDALTSSNACGGTYVDTDLIAAIPPNFFDFAKHCEKPVTIQLRDSEGYAKGDPVIATVVDQCDSCGPNDLKLSPGLWDEFYLPSGTIQVDILWSF